jgi:glycosyltransferase involved in cell wall biosynthesis
VTAPLVVGVDARELSGRPTGTGRYLRSLLRQWTAHNEDRFLAYFNGPPPDDPVLRHPRVEVRALGSGRERGIFWQERRLAPAAQSDGLDVFFSPAYSCPLSLDIPRVTAVHDLSFFARPDDFTMADALRRRVLVGASIGVSRSVLACSAFTEREIGSRFPDATARVVHVPLAADDLPPAVPRADARACLGTSGPFLLTAGAILNRRCLPTLLQAAAQLRRAWPDLVLDVVGENRTHPAIDIPRLLRRLGLESTVRLSGFVSEADLVLRYSAADVAVFLSEYEGFGLPALEAAAFEVPLVTSTRPSLSQIFADAALLAEPRDPLAVAAAIGRVLAEPDLREDLRRRGKALAARHSWRTTAERTRLALLRAAGR